MSSKHAISRRSFLKGTAAAASSLAIPAIIPASALGSQGVPAPSERVRLGFIGVKNRGMQNLRPLVQHAAALCDVDKHVLGAAKEHVEKTTGHTCATYSDYRALLDSKVIDAVVISTPDHWHALQTVDACRAGKDVFCEKPLTLTIEEGKAMVRAARQYKRVVQTGSQQRSGSEFAAAVDLVRGGALGKLSLVKVGISKNNFNEMVVPDSDPPAELDYDSWLGPAPSRPYNKNRVHYNFRFFWNYSGGQMTNWGAHHLDIAQWGLGMDASGPVSIDGKGGQNPGVYYEVPDWYDVTFRYADGVVVHCATSNRGGTEFIGEKGSVWVNRGKIEVKPAELLAAPPVSNRSEAAHHANWLECIKTRKLPVADVAIGHRTATLCHLANISVRSGRKVAWDPVKEVIVGDSDLSQMTSYAYRSPWKLQG